MYRYLRVAQNTKHKTKQNKKTFKTYYTEPGKCFIVYYCVLFFPPAGLLAVTYNDTGYVKRDHGKQCGSGAHAGAREPARLGLGKSNMLVGLFHNLRLLKRMRKLLYTEQCVGWKDEDEKTGSFALVLSSLSPCCVL